MKLPVGDERFYDLLAAWGTPYSWGAGEPKLSIDGWPRGVKGLKGGIGWDCSGFAQAALVRLGILSPDAPDRSSAALFDATRPVPAAGERMGDLAFYGPLGRASHVMVVVGPGVVLGARGGDQTTNGDAFRAFVQLEPLMYWSAFLGVRRFPE